MEVRQRDGGPRAGERVAYVARGVLDASEAAAVLGLAEEVSAAKWAAEGGASAAGGLGCLQPRNQHQRIPVHARISSDFDTRCFEFC